MIRTRARIPQSGTSKGSTGIEYDIVAVKLQPIDPNRRNIESKSQSGETRVSASPPDPVAVAFPGFRHEPTDPRSALNLVFNSILRPQSCRKFKSSPNATQHDLVVSAVSESPMSFLLGRHRSRSDVASAHHAHDDIKPVRHRSPQSSHGDENSDTGFFHGLFRRRSSDGLVSSGLSQSQSTQKTVGPLCYQTE